MSKIISVSMIQKPFDPLLSEGIHAPFACLLYSNQENVTTDEMIAVANWLLASGCRYAVCAGTNCSQWHDAIVTADIDRDPTGQSLVITSWRETESIKDIVRFWLNAIDIDDVAFENYLALFIGASNVNSEIQRAISASNDSFVVKNLGETV
jgi:hypothetical protein